MCVHSKGRGGSNLADLLREPLSATGSPLEVVADVPIDLRQRENVTHHRTIHLKVFAALSLDRVLKLRSHLAARAATRLLMISDNSASSTGLTTWLSKPPANILILSSTRP